MKTETEDWDFKWKLPWQGKVAVYLILAFFFTVPACTVIIGFDDVDVASAESAATIASIKAKAELAKQQTAAVERFVKEFGYSAMAARCAVYGWDNGNERVACEEASEQQARKQ